MQPHGLQHTRAPCPSPTPRACSNSCPSSWWCLPTISSCRTFLSCLQSFPASRSFQCVSYLHQVAKYWGFSFSISPSNEYSGMIPFRMDWFDFFEIYGTLKSLLQHQSSKASILQCSTFLHPLDIGFVCLHFHLSPKYILISLLTYSFTCWSFSSLPHNLHI